MRDGGYLSLADVTQMLLVAHGAESLADAQMFQGYVMDFADPDSLECRVVARYAGKGMLVPYVEAAEAVTPDLGVASARVLSYLTNECLVDERAASLVTDGIALGVARWRGIVWGSAPRTTPGERSSPVGRAAVIMAMVRKAERRGSFLWRVSSSMPRDSSISAR